MGMTPRPPFINFIKKQKKWYGMPSLREKDGSAVPSRNQTGKGLLKLIPSLFQHETYLLNIDLIGRTH